MIALKKGVLTEVQVFMENSTTPKTGKTGITTPTIYYRKAGGAWTLKSDISTWAEGDSTNAPGWYSFQFSATELNTAGFFAWHITATGAYCLPCELFLVTNDAGDAYTSSADVHTDVGTAIAAIANLDSDLVAAVVKIDEIAVDTDTIIGYVQTTGIGAIATNVETILEGILGGKKRVKAGGTWTDTFYERDNATVVGSFTYTITPTQETRTYVAP